jgi:uncharacterized paraquat-inducible protein A
VSAYGVAGAVSQQGELAEESIDHPMELTFECPKCGVAVEVPSVESTAMLSCPGCGWTRSVDRPANPDGQLAACAVCATDELYIQKDFPHILGLAIVVAGFAVSTVFWAYYLPIAALLVLLLTAALDLVLYYLVPDVTICYRCLSQYRGQGANPQGRFAPFDLAIGERYRQERLRVEQLRERQQPADPPT